MSQVVKSGAEDSVAVLIRDARRGSHEALGRLLEKYRDYLLVIARSELDRDLQAKGGASDLVQETFLEAQRDFDQFQGDDREAAARWLRELLRNNIADFVRRHRTQRRNVSREEPLEEAFGERGWPAGDAGPSEQAIAIERADQLRRAIERLPEDYRHVVLLRHVGKLSWNEVAIEMNRSPGAVQKLWIRALEQIRQQMPPD